MINFAVLSTLYLGLIDEQYYPEILNYDWNSINFFKELIVYQNELINKAKSFSKFNYTAKLLKEIEIFRILGILKSYHRNRIWKLENSLPKTRDLNKIFSRINRSEEYFTISLKSILSSHENFLICDFNYKTVALKNLYWGKVDENYSLNQHGNFIFFRLFETIRSCFILTLDEIFIIKLLTNLTFCMKYPSITYLIYSKIVCLV